MRKKPRPISLISSNLFQLAIGIFYILDMAIISNNSHVVVVVVVFLFGELII